MSLLRLLSPSSYAPLQPGLTRRVDAGNHIEEHQDGGAGLRLCLLNGAQQAVLTVLLLLGDVDKPRHLLFLLDVECGRALGRAHGDFWTRGGTRGRTRTRRVLEVLLGRQRLQLLRRDGGSISDAVLGHNNYKVWIVVKLLGWASCPAMPAGSRRSLSLKQRAELSRKKQMFGAVFNSSHDALPNLNATKRNANYKPFVNTGNVGFAIPCSSSFRLSNDLLGSSTSASCASYNASEKRGHSNPSRTSKTLLVLLTH